VYSPTTIIRFFVVHIWFRLDSNRSLHNFLSIDLPYNRKIIRACGLSLSHLPPPSRRTFNRRIKTLSADIQERITTAMGNLFISQDIAKAYILAVDSTLLRSKGKVWHRSSMKKDIVPRQGIDTDARRGYSHTKEGWIFGYKLHMMSSTDSAIIPLSAEVTTANVSDNQVYPALISYLSSETIRKIHFMVADPGYDDQPLYSLTMARGIQLVCPIRRYKNTSAERLQLVDFYQLALGQIIYSRRSTSIEPLIEHIKSVFRIDPVPARGYDKAYGFVLLSILLYQILVY
jgi:hypothetical protein